jgi:hypothetical protein
MNLNLKIQAPGKNYQAPWRPGAMYLSTPAYSCIVKFMDFEDYSPLGYDTCHLANTNVPEETAAAIFRTEVIL